MSTLRQILRLSRLEAEKAEKAKIIALNTPKAKKEQSGSDGKAKDGAVKTPKQAVSERERSSSKRKRRLSEVEGGSQQEQQRTASKRTRGTANNNSSGNDNNIKKKKSVSDIDLIQIPELPVYKKRGPKPKHIKEAEAAHAAAVAAQKKRLMSPSKKKGKRKLSDAGPEPSPKKIKKSQQVQEVKRGRGRPPKNTPKLQASDGEFEDKDKDEEEDVQSYSSNKKDKDKKKKKKRKDKEKSKSSSKFGRESEEEEARPKRGPGRPALNKNEKREKEMRYDGPMRTTSRSKKQVNYANNGAGKTGGVNTLLAEEEKKIAEQKEKQRLQNQRQSVTINTPVSEMPRSVVKWIECTKCGKWRKVGLGIDVDALPDNWRCNMNNWDLARANCTVPEETDDKSKNVNSGSGLFSGIGAYKKIGTHELSYRQLIYTYYKQTTASFRKKLAQRGTNEFKKSFAYHDADDEIEQIAGTKKEKKKTKKAKVNKFARTLPPRIYAKFKKYRGIKIKRRRDESSSEEVDDDENKEEEEVVVQQQESDSKRKEEEKEVEKNNASH